MSLYLNSLRANLCFLYNNIERRSLINVTWVRYALVTMVLLVMALSNSNNLDVKTFCRTAFFGGSAVILSGQELFCFPSCCCIALYSYEQLKRRAIELIFILPYGIGRTLIQETALKVLNVWFFTGAGCDTDHHRTLENPAVSKQTTHKFYMEKFNLKKLNDVCDKRQ
jgi:hypothetical protein